MPLYFLVDLLLIEVFTPGNQSQQGKFIAMPEKIDISAHVIRLYDQAMICFGRDQLSIIPVYYYVLF